MRPAASAVRQVRGNLMRRASQCSPSAAREESAKGTEEENRRVRMQPWLAWIHWMCGQRVCTCVCVRVCVYVCVCKSACARVCAFPSTWMQTPPTTIFELRVSVCRPSGRKRCASGGDRRTRTAVVSVWMAIAQERVRRRRKESRRRAKEGEGESRRRCGASERAEEDLKSKRPLRKKQNELKRERERER